MQRLAAKCIYFVVSCILWPQITVKSQDPGHKTPDPFLTDRLPLPDFMSYGKLWHIYVDANAYVVIRDAMRINSNVKQRTIPSFTEAMIPFLGKRNPCRFSTYTDIPESAHLIRIQPQNIEEWLLKLNNIQYMFWTESKICGSLVHPIIVPAQAYVWTVNVNHNFKMNITILELKAKVFLRCTDICAVLFDVYDYDGNEFDVLGKFCPNSPPYSFYSSGIQARIAVYIVPYHLAHARSNTVRTGNNTLAHLKCLYQVLDNDFTLKSFEPVVEHRVPTPHDPASTEQSYLRVGILETGKVPEAVIGLKSSHVPASNLSSHFSQSALLPTAKNIASGKFNNIFLYVIHVQTAFGVTISIYSGSFICERQQGKTLFYDGPPLDLMQMDTMVSRLDEWNCNVSGVPYFTESKNKTPVTASIGDLTLALILKSTFHRVQLEVDIQLRKSKWITFENIYVPPFTASISFLDQDESSMHILNIQTSENQYVKLFFKELAYTSYFYFTCHNGGIFLFSDVAYVGGICSNIVARMLLDHYSMRGMRLGRFVQIVIKQYTRLSRILARFYFSTDTCIGHVNLLPYFLYHVNEIYRIRGAQVRKVRIFYDFPLNLDMQCKSSFWEQDWYQFDFALDYWHTLYIRRDHGVCLRIQVMSLDHVPTGAETSAYAMLYLSTVNRREYSNISISHSKSPSLETFCLDQMRVHLDTRENYTELLPQHPEDKLVYHGMAYNAKVFIPTDCLRAGSVLTFQLETPDDGLSYVCFEEFGKYLYDVSQPIIPQGTCGRMNLIPQLYLHGYNWRDVKVSFQKPLDIPSCCYYSIAVKSTGGSCAAYHASVARHLSRKDFFVQWEWTKVNITKPLMWEGRCLEMFPYRDALMGLVTFDTCLDLEITTANVACSFDLIFRASLQKGSTEAGYIVQNNEQQQICSVDSCYVASIVSVNITWYEASQLCQGKGGQLVSTSSDEEWRFLNDRHINISSGEEWEFFNDPYIGKYSSRITAPFFVHEYYIGFKEAVSILLGKLPGS